ncbi:MAG: rhodanese-like domain-containing protein [bacterium]|nr:rhodanese-like domain-containing protein [bacterium]
MQLLILLLISCAVSIGVNAVSPNGIDLIGKYRDLSSSEGPIVPPTAEPSDPPFIDINVAQMEHAAGQALFVDARNPEDFECSTIPGSVNLPFEMLPEGDLAPFFDSVLAAPKDRMLIVFCSGEECDLSLHLGRNLQLQGYTNIAIFFGGAREWEKFGLDVERRKQCE